jgi:hypothetical protein
VTTPQLATRRRQTVWSARACSDIASLPCFSNPSFCLFWSHTFTRNTIDIERQFGEPDYDLMRRANPRLFTETTFPDFVSSQQQRYLALTDTQKKHYVYLLEHAKTSMWLMNKHDMQAHAIRGVLLLPHGQFLLYCGL